MPTFQGLLLGSVRVLEYGVAVWLGFFLWVLVCEEPTLRSKFGADFREFCAGRSTLDSSLEAVEEEIYHRPTAKYRTQK